MNLHHANLWIGPEESLKQQAIQLLQQQLCSQQGCGICYSCKSIIERQHHALTWLEPENYYTVKQMHELFSAICFALQPGEKHFIVIERADLFTTASANSILKSLEEPVPGYHYLLLAPRTEGILPTIRSRCVVEQFGSGEPASHRLMSYFTSYDFSQANSLMSELQKERLREREVDHLLDALVHHWHAIRKQALMKDHQQLLTKATKVITLFEDARQKPPMPGSAKLFLKNLYLKMALAI